MNNIIPYVYAKNIFDVNIDFFKKLDVKYVFSDLDNTLDSYKCILPSDRTIAFAKTLKENGITLIVASNNTQKRVSKYADVLDCKFVHSLKKPLAKKLLQYINSNNIAKEECIFIGDQLLTDVLVANRAGIKSMLTDKLVKEDAIYTRFNRLFDKPIRNKLKRKKKLREWSELYGTI